MEALSSLTALSILIQCLSFLLSPAISLFSLVLFSPFLIAMWFYFVYFILSVLESFLKCLELFCFPFMK